MRWPYCHSTSGGHASHWSTSAVLRQLAAVLGGDHDELTRLAGYA